MLKDDIVIMKKEVKNLAAITFSALSVLAFSPRVFCKGSSAEYFGGEFKNFEKNMDVVGNPNSFIDKVYIACPEDKVELNMFYGNLKQLIYPINTFDVERFHKVIYLNNINRTWNFFIVDNDEKNPLYGFCAVFAKDDKSVSFFFNPMETLEKFVGPNWWKNGFSFETLFGNFEKFVMSFGFEERKFSAKHIKDCTDFKVPEEIKYLGDETFRNFSNLKKIVIPSTVEKISSGAFKNCKNLQSIEYMGRNYSSVKDFMEDFKFFNQIMERHL